MVKKSKNLKKSQKITFFQFFFFIFFFPLKKKNDILLVFQYQEDRIRPELSSPPHFRILGGQPERDTGGAGVVVVAGRYFPFLIQDQGGQPERQSVPESTTWDVKTSTTHFPVPFGPIFQIFFFEIFFDLFFTAGNFLTVRDPPYGEKLEIFSECCF